MGSYSAAPKTFSFGPSDSQGFTLSAEFHLFCLKLKSCAISDRFIYILFVI